MSSRNGSPLRFEDHAKDCYLNQRCYREVKKTSGCIAPRLWSDQGTLFSTGGRYYASPADCTCRPPWAKTDS